MKYLTLKDSLYNQNTGTEDPNPIFMDDDNKENNTEASDGALLVSIVGQAIDTDGIESFKDFSETLSGKKHILVLDLEKEDPTLKDKGTIIGLLNRYPDVKESDDEKKKFKEHLLNIYNSGNINPGGLKYLLLVLLDLIRPEPEPEQKSNPEDIDNKNNPNQTKPVEVEQQQQEQASPNNTEYSSIEDVYNDRETTLSEQDFSNMIDYEELEEYLNTPSLTRASSEFIKNNPEHLNRAEKFLQRKRDEVWNKKYKNKKNSLFSANDNEEFVQLNRAQLFLKNKFNY